MVSGYRESLLRLVQAPLRRTFGRSSSRVRSELQQIRLHVGDLVLAVPFAQEEVVEAVGLEPAGAGDKPVLVSTGAVPERDMCRGLGNAADSGAGCPQQTIL